MEIGDLLVLIPTFGTILTILGTAIAVNFFNEYREFSGRVYGLESEIARNMAEMMNYVKNNEEITIMFVELSQEAHEQAIAEGTYSRINSRDLTYHIIGFYTCVKILNAFYENSMDIKNSEKYEETFKTAVEEGLKALIQIREVNNQSFRIYLNSFIKRENVFSKETYEKYVELWENETGEEIDFSFKDNPSEITDEKFSNM